MRRPGRWLRRLLVLGVAGGVLAGAGVLAFLQHAGITPRALGPYVGKRAEGHNDTIRAIGAFLQTTLVRLDRGDSAPLLDPLSAGAQLRGRDGGAIPGELLTASVDEARQFLLDARPGAVLTFLPGTYRFDGSVKSQGGGREGKPVIVRARVPGSVILEMRSEEGFQVSGPYWIFRDLIIRGACASHADCEHAFHIFGNAKHFSSINNHIADFNAHFKINALDGVFPDSGLIEHNTLTNTRIRATSNPVVPIDIVAASGWTIRANLITDFIKGDGNLVSYGGFAKGAGSHNVFEQNVVLCEHRLHFKGQRVGLSLGGGGSGGVFCRDGKCITEQEDSIIRDNLVAHCSDAGIYLNSAARSTISHNTLIDTAGVDVRFATSSADLQGNLIDGVINARDQATARASDNLVTPASLLYFGWHPQRRLLRAPLAGDFGWAGEPPRRALASERTPDLCGKPRPAKPAYGAFEDFRACLLQP